MFTRTFVGVIASSRGGGVVLTQGTIYDDPNYYPASSGPNACNPPPGPPPTPPPAPVPYDVWYTGTLIAGDYVYADSAGTIPWPSGWWKINITGGSDVAVELNSSGEILNTFSC